MSQTTKVVIPVAGLGTRFLPATKSIPKAMLPVVDKPSIQYVVEEAAAAGLTDVILVTGRNQSSIEDHFDVAPELEAALEKKGDVARLQAVREATGVATLHCVRQGVALGLGHAVLQAADHVGEHPFAVQLGDDLIDPRNPILPAMLRVQQELGGSVIALMEVPEDQIGLYGAAAVGEPVQVPGVEQRVVPVESLVEKPSPADAPSNLAVIGRYVLNPAVFSVLRQTAPGRGGEIQLTDALATLAAAPVADGGGVHGVVFSGKRYDTGDRLDYLKAVVQLGLDREDLGPPFAAWLREYLNQASV